MRIETQAEEQYGPSMISQLQLRGVHDFFFLSTQLCSQANHAGNFTIGISFQRRAPTPGANDGTQCQQSECGRDRGNCRYGVAKGIRRQPKPQSAQQKSRNPQERLHVPLRNTNLHDQLALHRYVEQ
jgi:hypothetical protein